MRFDIEYKPKSRRNSVEKCVEHGLGQSVHAREKLLELGELEMEVHETQHKEENRCPDAKRLGVAPVSLLDMEKQANDEYLKRTYGEQSLNFAHRSQFRSFSRGSTKSQREGRTGSSSKATSKATSKVSDPGGSSGGEESGEEAEEAFGEQQQPGTFMLRSSMPGNMQHRRTGFLMSSDLASEQAPVPDYEDSQVSEAKLPSTASAPMPRKLTSSLSAKAKPAWDEERSETEPAFTPTTAAGAATSALHSHEAASASRTRESKPSLLDRLRHQFAGSARRLRTNSSSGSSCGRLGVGRVSQGLQHDAQNDGSDSGEYDQKCISMDERRHSVSSAGSSVRSLTHMGSRTIHTTQRSPPVTTATLQTPLSTSMPRCSKDALHSPLSTRTSQSGFWPQAPSAPRHGSLQDTGSEAFLSPPTTRSSLPSSRQSLECGSSSRKTSCDRSAPLPSTNHRARSRSCVITQGEAAANIGGPRPPCVVNHTAPPSGTAIKASGPAAAAAAASAAFAAQAGPPRRKSLTIVTPPSNQKKPMDGIIADLLAP